ncbi:MAG: TetR/AcrR family transcriptional regulator [Ilumatobacteraceae bacterium]
MAGEKRGRVDSKTLLIDAALEVIENEGVNALRLDAIAASVGVTKGSLYWHFKDRDDLIRAALHEQMRRLTESSMSGVSEALASSKNLAEYLLQVQSVVADPYNEAEVAQRWRRLELLVAARQDPELSKVMREIQVHGMAAYTQLMRDAQESGILHPDLDPAAVAVAISALAMGANVLISTMGDDAPSRESWFGLMAFLIRAGAPPEANRSSD